MDFMNPHGFMYVNSVLGNPANIILEASGNKVQRPGLPDRYSTELMLLLERDKDNDPMRVLSHSVAPYFDEAILIAGLHYYAKQGKGKYNEGTCYLMGLSENFRDPLDEWVKKGNSIYARRSTLESTRDKTILVWTSVNDLSRRVVRTAKGDDFREACERLADRICLADYTKASKMIGA